MTLDSDEYKIQKSMTQFRVESRLQNSEVPLGTYNSDGIGMVQW